MRKLGLIAAVGLLLLGCGRRDETVTEPTPAPESSSTTTTISEREAFASELEAAGFADAFTPEEAARDICNDPSPNSVSQIGLDRPRLARAAYAWKCPDHAALSPAELEQQVQAAAADRAAAEQQAQAAAEQERQAEAAAQAAAQAEAERAAAIRQEIGINAEEFAQVQNGMNRAQVESIIGSPGEVLVETSVSGYNGLVLMWKGEPGTGLGANANMQFQNGVLISKAQFGL